MTRFDVEACRADAIKLVLLSVVNHFGPRHGRLLPAATIIKTMGTVRQDLFSQLDTLVIANPQEAAFTRTSLDNALNIFECVMNFKEGPHFIDILRLGVSHDLGV